MAGALAHRQFQHQPPSSFSRLLLLLTLLPLTLASIAFVLQWRGGVTDPLTRWSPDQPQFPGMSFADSTPSRRTYDCTNPLSQSLNPSFPYFRDWNFDFSPHLSPKICVTTSTSAGLEQTLPWIFYHKVIGVSSFLLFVEGKAALPNVTRVLESIPGVKVVFRTRELEEQQAKSRIWNETWLASFFYKPCNYELFVKQSLNMEMAIVMARDSGMDWIIHLDTDELMHPAGTPEYSLRQLLADVPGNVDMVIFPNYESSVERDDIREPFSEFCNGKFVLQGLSGLPGMALFTSEVEENDSRSEQIMCCVFLTSVPLMTVSMFKKNYDHLPKDVYFGNYKESTRGNPNYFLTYGNGKSAARIQDHLRPNGAHRWHNYMKTPKEIKLEEAAVLHYTYTKFSDLTSRRDRCGCKPTKEDVKRCFMLDFDRSAFIIASTATEEEMLQWYRERIVWTDKALNIRLIRKGILTRIYAPMIIIQSLRESGVFSSVIAKATQTNLSKEKFLKSVDSSNSTRNSRSDMFSSRKFDAGRLSQATGRRILKVIDDSLPSAIPPLSPPNYDHADLIT
ncbi:hypothetical protein V8G54_022381 [Vigna mungo]|uniref:Glycosyltransferase family 92 protein n=1 Tax=Vigna mungo TaxID=3915 RepID=A0AAQ3NG07_VIGMU